MTDQNPPLIGLCVQCTGSSRRSRAKEGPTLSSANRRGFATSIRSSGIENASARARSSVVSMNHAGRAETLNR
jgi:hypothetical protein